jgi:hypothetical protein
MDTNGKQLDCDYFLHSSFQFTEIIDKYFSTIISFFVFVGSGSERVVESFLKNENKQYCVKPC